MVMPVEWNGHFFTKRHTVPHPPPVFLSFNGHSIEWNLELYLSPTVAHEVFTNWCNYVFVVVLILIFVVVVLVFV